MTEFVQGITKRWGIAWSFLPYRPRHVINLLHTRKLIDQDVACPAALALRDFTPKSSKYIIRAPLSPSFTIPILHRFLSTLRTLQYTWENNVCIAAFAGNVWSRSARRKNISLQEEPMQLEEEARVGVRLGVTAAGGDTSQVKIEWRIGTDVILFHSFCGRVKNVVLQPQ